jgi:N utilization substance protein A
MALVVVPDDQLSLAIGREGQNARLAAKLTSWRIDIKGSSESVRETLLQVDADPEIKERLAGTVALVQAALQRHAEQQLPWNTDEMQQIKLLIDGQHHFVTARRRAEREKARAAQVAAEAPLPTAELLPSETARQEAINAYRARIPVAAYATPVGELGLNSRVLGTHRTIWLDQRSQIHERLATGDEAMLAIDGIGPKGLAHIKQVIDEKGLGLKSISVEAAPAAGEAAQVEQPIEPAPTPEPIMAEEKPAEVAAAVAPPPVEEQPAVAATVEQPAAEAVVVPPTGPIDIKEIEDEEELERKGGKKKRRARPAHWSSTKSMVSLLPRSSARPATGKDVIDLGEEDL